MAVTLSSDLLVGVLDAGQPARVKAAERRLNVAPDSIGFASAMQEARAIPVARDLLQDVMAAADPLARSAATEKLSSLSVTDPVPAAYAGLEETLVRNMFEMMLPRETSGAYGEGPGASIWRSMAAGQYASLFVSAGGLGLAEDVANRYAGDSIEEAGWPSYSARTITSFTG